MEFLKNAWNKTKDFFSRVWDNIMDSNTFVRWGLLVLFVFVLMQFAGFDIEEFRVTLLLLWYALVSTFIASFMNYVYGKVNYHRAKENSTHIIAQTIIFVGVYIFSGLVILGTYIAQYN